jgi:hypothetical protein
MLCLCKQQITALGGALGPLIGLPPLSLTIDLTALSLKLGALSAAAQLAGVSSEILLSLPGLPIPALSASISASAVAQLGGLGLAVQAAKSGLGVDLLASASVTMPRLNALAASISLHAPLLKALLAALENELAKLLPAVQALQAAQSLGVNLLLPSASIQLAGLAAQAARLSISFPPMTPALAARLNLAAAIQIAHSRFGINLLLPGGMLKLQLALKALLALKLPSLLLEIPGLSPVALGNLSLLGALLAALKALGINLLAPGVAASLPQLLAPLLSLSLPPIPFPPLPSFSLALMAPAAALDLSASAVAALQLDLLGPMLAVQLPSFGAMASLAVALQMIAEGTGIKLAWAGPLACSGSCPLAPL